MDRVDWMSVSDQAGVPGDFDSVWDTSIVLESPALFHKGNFKATDCFGVFPNIGKGYGSLVERDPSFKN